MGNEASKTVALWGEDIRSLLTGKGLDIGAGEDPVVPGVRTFDQVHGDANRIDDFIKDEFDFVFSSHCLEHMHDPSAALRRWWSLVKPGGHLIILVPDEDLYEQGYWPSLFNEDHKHTFTLNTESWSPVSINIQNLIADLPDAEVLSISLQSHGYDETLYLKRPKSRSEARIKIWLSKKLRKLFSLISYRIALSVPRWIGAPVDQTAHDALAQIQFILKKKSPRV